MSASRTSASHPYRSSFFCFFPEGVACPGVLGCLGAGVFMVEAGVEFPLLGLNANLEELMGVLGTDSGGDCFCFFMLFRDEGSSGSLSVALG